MKTVFMGTPDFAATVLEHLYNSNNKVELVVTQPDRARDRGKKISFSPVKVMATEHGTKILQPEKIRTEQDIIQKIREISPDVIAVAAYGQILPSEILEIPKFGCVNVHASLLPKLRGASPIQHAIITGEEITGVTIMQMAEGLDTGDMLAQEQVRIDKRNSQQLHDILAEMGGKLLVKTLDLMEKGQVRAVPQNEADATYAGLIYKNDGKIDFADNPQKVERLIRAFDPWPGAFCSLNGKTVKFWKADVCEDKTDAEPGTIINVDDTGIKIACGGKILKVTELQMPGKKRVKVGDYLRGNRLENGMRFE